MEEIESWALEPEVGKVEEEVGVGGERRVCTPFIKAKNIERLLTGLKARLFPRDRQQHGWITHAHINKDPVMRGHDLCFDKTCQWKPHLETRSGRLKNSLK